MDSPSSVELAPSVAGANEARVAEAEVEDIECISCHEKGLKPEDVSIVLRANTKRSKHIYRCKRCNACKSRCERLVQSHGTLVKDWTTVSTEKKKEFYKENYKLANENLIVKMQEAIQDTKRMTSITQFKGTGVWLDKKDLEEKYKNKPDHGT